MIPAILALLPMVFGIGMGSAVAMPQVRRIIVENQLIIRVPVSPEPSPQVELVEHKGPKCIPSGDIRGALLAATDHVDFVMAGRRLLRARLDEDCPALDFYAGFYLSSDDGNICIKRDSIHSRMGGSCRIDRFRLLVPKVR